MLRKCFLVPAVLSLAVVCFAVDAAQAQSRRAARQERRDSRRGINRIVEADVNSTGVISTSERPGSVYTYEGPGYSTRSVSYYYSPATERVVVPANGATAEIRVILPDASARVLFDGVATKQTGLERSFTTPTLAPGTHTYAIRVTWMAEGRSMSHERIINVAPGRITMVDLARR